MNNAVHGRQLRLLFKMENNIIPFEPHQLDNARALIEKYRTLNAGQ